jgi:hypothetical protein
VFIKNQAGEKKWKKNLKWKPLSQIGLTTAAALNRPLLNPARRSRKAAPRSP